MTSVNDTNSESLTGLPSDVKETSNLVENEIATDADDCSIIKNVEIMSESCDDDDSDDYDSASFEDDEEGEDNDEKDNNEGDEESCSDESEGSETDADEQGDSSDDSTVADTEQCAICLNRLRDQQIGTPESCDHNFCLDCITEWAKTVNTCPIDRQVFYLIFTRQVLGGPIIKQVTVEENRPVDSGELLPDNTVCEVCASGLREDSLLLCDGCNLGYHMDCLSPPLSRIPRGDWFCPTCQSVAPSVLQNETEVDEIVARSSRRRHQVVARTIVSEQVRARIRRIRHIVDSEDESDPTFKVSGDRDLNTAKPRRAIKRRKSGKKRKTGKRKRRSKTKGSKSASGLKKQKRRRRRSKKKQKARTKTAVKTPKTRIAERLHIGLPPQGRFIPTVKDKNSSVFIESRRSDATVSTFSVMGSKMELTYFSDQHEVPTNEAQVKSTQESTLCESSNLLDMILQDQSKLMTSASMVKIQRDGSLSVHETEKNVRMSQLGSSSKDELSPTNVKDMLDITANIIVESEDKKELKLVTDDTVETKVVCEEILIENVIEANVTLNQANKVTNNVDDVLVNSAVDQGDNKGHANVLTSGLLLSNEGNNCVSTVSVTKESCSAKKQEESITLEIVVTKSEDSVLSKENYETSLAGTNANKDKLQTLMNNDDGNNYLTDDSSDKQEDKGKTQSSELINMFIANDEKKMLNLDAKETNISNADDKNFMPEKGEKTSKDIVEENQMEKKDEKTDERSERHKRRREEEESYREENKNRSGSRDFKKDYQEEVNTNRKRIEDDRNSRRGQRDYQRDDRKDSRREDQRDDQRNDQRDDRRDSRREDQRDDQQDDRRDSRREDRRYNVRDDRSRDKDRSSGFRERDGRRRDRSEDKRENRIEHDGDRRSAREVDEFGRMPRKNFSPSPKRSSPPASNNVVPLMSLVFSPKHVTDVKRAATNVRDDSSNDNNAFHGGGKRKRTRWQQEESSADVADSKGGESRGKEPPASSSDTSLPQPLMPPSGINSLGGGLNLLPGTAMLRMESGPSLVRMETGPAMIRLDAGSEIMRMESMEESPPMDSPEMDDHFSVQQSFPDFSVQHLMRPQLPMMLSQGLPVVSSQGLLPVASNQGLLPVANSQGLQISGMRPLILNEHGMPMQAVMIPGQGMTLVPQNVMTGLRQPILVNLPMRGPHPLLAGMSSMGVQAQRLVGLIPQLPSHMNLHPENSTFLINEGGFPNSLGQPLLRPMVHPQSLHNVTHQNLSNEQMFIDEDDENYENYEEDMWQQESESHRFGNYAEPPNTSFAPQPPPPPRMQDILLPSNIPLPPPPPINNNAMLQKHPSHERESFTNSNDVLRQDAINASHGGTSWQQDKYPINANVNNNLWLENPTANRNELFPVKPPDMISDKNTRQQLSNIKLPERRMENVITNQMALQGNSEVKEAPLMNVRTYEIKGENQAVQAAHSNPSNPKEAQMFHEDSPPTVAEILQRLSNSLNPLFQATAKSETSGKTSMLHASETKLPAQGGENVATDNASVGTKTSSVTKKGNKESVSSTQGNNDKLATEFKDKQKSEVKHKKSSQHDSGGKKSENKEPTKESSQTNVEYVDKLTRQKRVEEEVKMALKPYFNKGEISKEEYKDIMRKAVPKICHSKSGDINPTKIQDYVAACITQIELQKKHEGKKQEKGQSNTKEVLPKQPKELKAERTAETAKLTDSASVAEKTVKTVTSADVVKFIRNIPLPM